MTITGQELNHYLRGKEYIGFEELYVYGTGNTACLYQEAFSRLGISLSGYIDSDPLKWGRDFLGLPIMGIEDLRIDSNSLILICSARVKAVREIAAICEKNGKPYCTADEYIFSIHREELLAAYDSISGQVSRDIYAEIAYCRCIGAFPREDLVSDNQYFSMSRFRSCSSNEVFIDVGAYVGDSIDAYIRNNAGVFKKVIAFEPDEINVNAIKHRMKRLMNEWNLSESQFEICRMGVSDVDDIMLVERKGDSNGLSSRMISDITGDQMADECRVISIDSYVQDRYDFLKADIEGYEIKMLNGARQSISKYSPKLAICIYHNPADYFQIPLLIKSIEPNYKLEVRHYSCDMLETVLYAYMD